MAQASKSPFVREIGNSGSLMTHAYEVVKEAICNNEIKPGDVLSENQIAKGLGMSRTPVREALRILASEDYVDVRNGTGIIVKSISPEDMRALTQVRKSLELLAAETAVHNIQISEIEQLEKSFLALLDDYNQKKPLEIHDFTSRDYQLHELLVARCTNKYVISIMKGIHANVKRFQCMSYVALNSLPESTEQHLNLLRLIRERDGDGLVRALGEHIDWAQDCLAM